MPPGRASKSPPSKRRPRRRPSIDFSLTGLVYCAMMLFMGLAAVNSQTNVLFGVFGLMLGIFIVSFATSRTVLRRLEVKRLLPEYATVGRPCTLQYEFTNRKRYWPSFSVGVLEVALSDPFTKQPQAYMLHAAAGMTATVPIQAVPRRRGLHSMEALQLSTGFPFGFIRRSILRQQSDTLVVYPAMAKVQDRLLERCLSAEHGDSRMRPRRGGAEEFYGVKEYRQGDNPRWINWRRSARTGVLVSNEMGQVAPPRLVIYLDTRLRGRTRAEQALVERTIAMAASLIDHALATGLSVGLHAWANEWVGIPPSRGKRHRRELLTTLARLPGNESHNVFETLRDQHRGPRPGTTLVMVTPREAERSLGELARGEWLTISASSEQARKSFAFEAGVDFNTCMPVDLESGESEGTA